MEPEHQAPPPANQRLRALLQGFQWSKAQTQLHYVIFRAVSWVKQPDGPIQHYRQQFLGSWEKWLGIGAGITGILLLLKPDGFWRWQLPFGVAVMLLAPLVSGFIATLSKLFTEYPGKHLIGQVVTLEHPIVDGSSKITLDNQEWIIVGPDCPAITTVKIIALNEGTLYVTPV